MKHENFAGFITGEMTHLNTKETRVLFRVSKFKIVQGFFVLMLTKEFERPNRVSSQIMSHIGCKILYL